MGYVLGRIGGAEGGGGSGGAGGDGAEMVSLAPALHHTLHIVFGIGKLRKVYRKITDDLRTPKKLYETFNKSFECAFSVIFQLLLKVRFRKIRAVFGFSKILQGHLKRA